MTTRLVPREGKDPIAVAISGSTESAELGILLTHGAGGDLNSGNLPQYALAFAKAGIPCVRMNFYPRTVSAGQDCMQAVLKHKDTGFPKVDRWILAGHSMGCRVASEIAHSFSSKVAALIFFSYPLHPPGKLHQLRDAPLQRLRQPILFVRGTRDSFSDTGKFESVLPSIPSNRIEVHTVEGGDHGLNVKGGKKAIGPARESLIRAAVQFAQSIAQPSSAGPSHEPIDEQHNGPPKKKAKIKEQ